jgi:hypothetical protein
MPRPRRLPRILLNAATAGSLVLCVATVALWVRSYLVADTWAWQSTRTAVGAATCRGKLDLFRDRRSSADRFPPPRWHITGSPLGRHAPSLLPGFAHFRHVSDWQILNGVQVPLWALTIVVGLLPAGTLRATWRRRREARRSQAGLCPACGYDLRATPERCPECGTIAAR